MYRGNHFWPYSNLKFRKYSSACIKILDFFFFLVVLVHDLAVRKVKEFLGGQKRQESRN